MPRNIEPRANERKTLDDAKPHVPDILPVPAGTPAMVYEKGAETGIREILNADRNFDVGRFVEGAQAAYAMILEAFWKGDKEELKTLCDQDVYESFAEVIDAREERGEVRCRHRCRGQGQKGQADRRFAFRRCRNPRCLDL